MNQLIRQVMQAVEAEEAMILLDLAPWPSALLAEPPTLSNGE